MSITKTDHYNHRRHQRWSHHPINFTSSHIGSNENNIQYPDFVLLGASRPKTTAGIETHHKTPDFPPLVLSHSHSQLLRSRSPTDTHFTAKQKSGENSGQIARCRRHHIKAMDTSTTFNNHDTQRTIIPVVITNIKTYQGNNTGSYINDNGSVLALRVRAFSAAVLF